MYRFNDALLYAVSARVEMPWKTFKETYAELYVRQQLTETDGELNRDRYSTMRTLDSLGHCDFAFGEQGDKVYAAPAVLARLPHAGPPTAVLTGFRTPGTFERLVQASEPYTPNISISMHKQFCNERLVPARLAVQASSLEHLAALADTLGLSFVSIPPAWSVLQLSASIGDIRQNLEWSGSGELNWSRRDFDHLELRFRPPAGTPQDSHLSRYSDPVRTTNLHVLWHGEQQAVVDADWGRYLILNTYSRRVLLYDERRFIVAVPLGTPLPKLISRALALCSGYAPAFTPASSIPDCRCEAWNYLCYRWVPPQIAGLAARKVGQALTSCSISADLGGDNA